MDLVEIRKKAKKNKKRKAESKPDPVVAAPVTESVTAQSVASSSSPPVPVSAADPVVPPSAAAEAYSEPETDGSDALERLFLSQNELSLATEESYLQALQGMTDEGLSNKQRWLSFALGREKYAISIEFVREIIKPREVTSIPRVPGFLLGIISLRGIIVPVIDLRRRLHLGEIATDEHTRILVCEEGDRIVGLLVDSITQVVQLGEDDIEPPPAILSGLDRELVEGVGRIQGQMVILLDLPQVLDMELN